MNEETPQHQHQQAWDNPWYPLQEAPRTEEERDRLTAHLRAQEQGVQDAFARKKGQARTIQAAAHSNCADLQLEHYHCLRQWLGKFRGECARLDARWQACIAKQTVGGRACVWGVNGCCCCCCCCCGGWLETCGLAQSVTGYLWIPMHRHT
jgi:hypothetical protein